MNLKELILFGMEESQEPVIKNPILQAALREPRPMTQGGRVGYRTGKTVRGSTIATQKPIEFYVDVIKNMIRDNKYVPPVNINPREVGKIPNFLKAKELVKAETGESFNVLYNRNIQKRKKIKRAADPEKRQRDLISMAERKGKRRVLKADPSDPVTITDRERALNFEQRKYNKDLNLKIRQNPDLILKDKSLMDKLSTTVSKDGNIIKVKPTLDDIKKRGIVEVEHQRDIYKKGKLKDLPYNRNFILGPYNREGGFKKRAETFIEKNPDANNIKVKNILKKAEELGVTLQPDVPKGTFPTKGIGYKQVGGPVEKFANAAAHSLQGSKLDLSPKKSVTALQELMQRQGAFMDPALAGRAVVEETGSLVKKPMTKAIGKGIGKAFNLGLGPAGMGGLTYALKPEDGYDLSRAEDRIGFEAEAALAPTLVKGVASVTDKIKNPLLRKGLETLAGVRIPGIMNPTNALRIARIASPMGLVSLAGEGLYHAGKKEMAKRKQMSPEELDAYMLEKQSRGWSKMSEGAYNQGGRVGLAKGSKGPKDPSKRLFIKGVAAASMIPILGKYFKLAKPAAKAVGQYTGPVIEKIKGLEWVQFLAKRLWDEGADVTETAARQEREIVRRGTLESGDDVDMVYNLDSGDVRFEVSPVKGSHQTSGGAYNDPYSLDYKAPQVIDEGKQAGTKIKSEIEVAESRPVQTDPETVELDGDYASVDDAFSDLTELEAFAKKKLTKEIHKAKGTKPKNVTPEYDPPDYPDIDYPDVDDFASGGRVSYFDGGIVGLKKKW